MAGAVVTPSDITRFPRLSYDNLQDADTDLIAVLIVLAAVLVAVILMLPTVIREYRVK